MVPKPLGIGSPPANGAPPGAVWQAAQSAASARYFPRATTSGGALTTCIGPPVLPDRRFLIANAAAANGRDCNGGGDEEGPPAANPHVPSRVRPGVVRITSRTAW